jgi:hypothetical protein
MCTRQGKFLSALVWLVTGVAAAQEPARVGDPATPFNQRLVSSKACGPTALLNAFRFGSPSWRRGLEATAGNSDKERISNTIRIYGMRPSHDLARRPRWSGQGINLSDLTAVANEMAASRQLPALKSEVLVPAQGHTSSKLLASAHKRFVTSLAAGFPPVLSLRRFAWRKTSDGSGAWLAVDAHYITLTSVAPGFDADGGRFTISYLDPNGGRRLSGQVRLADSHTPAGLLINCPRTSVGRDKVRPGEASVVMLSAVLGQW